MTELKSVVRYLCKHYPHKSELSKARLTKMVYLADWRCALKTGDQLTDVHWKYNHYGPYVPDVVDQTRNDPEFSIQTTVTPFGNTKELVSYRGDDDGSLSPEEAVFLDFVIDKTKSLTWDGFIKLVYSTYPIVVSDKQDDLNLPALAERYAAEKDELGLTAA